MKLTHGHCVSLLIYCKSRQVSLLKSKLSNGTAHLQGEDLSVEGWRAGAGLQTHPVAPPKKVLNRRFAHHTHVDFSRLWDSINLKGGFLLGVTPPLKSLTVTT